MTVAEVSEESKSSSEESENDALIKLELHKEQSKITTPEKTNKTEVFSMPSQAISLMKHIQFSMSNVTGSTRMQK